MVGKLTIPVGLHDLDQDVLHKMVMASFDRLSGGNLLDEFDPQCACVLSINTTILEQLIGTEGRKQDN